MDRPTATRPASPEPTGRFRIALVHGPAHTSGELADQLRVRLRAAATVLAAGFAAFLVLSLWVQGRAFLAAPLDRLADGPSSHAIPLCIGLAVYEAAFAWWLSGRRAFTLLGLRRVEWLVLAPPVLYCVYFQVRLPATATETAYRAVGHHLAESEVLPWVVFAVGYGILVPNTWRRCAAVVGGVAVLVAAIHTVAYTLRPLPGGLFWPMLAMKAIWFGLASMIVVYGAYRVQELRERAEGARELGQYRLTRRLGCGGMGEVFLAEHALLRRPCAVKVIRPERAGDPADLARFEREVRETARLTHPNTVHVYDHGRAEDGTFYYVMEYLPGPTLDELVRRHGPVSPARAVHFLRQVCGALAEAHGVGLTHRDVKPGNVIVCDRGGVPDTVKLLDFGLVLPPADGPDADRLTRAGSVLGTPAFLSPEQAAGEPADARSDLYSVGAVGYFLLTGRPPFAGLTAGKLLAAHIYEAPDPVRSHRPDVPADLAAIVARCLAKPPADRFVSAGELDAALAGCGVEPWTPAEAAEWWRSRPRTGDGPAAGAPTVLMTPGGCERL